jgi:hypothetical protein
MDEAAMSRTHTPLRLFHYSQQRVERFTGMGYAQLKDQMKPLGIWLSVGRAWQRWCEDENFSPERLTHVHRVTIATDHLLRLQSTKDIDVFTQRYAATSPLSEYRAIDWGRVARDYDGILIAPYCWSCRLTRHTSWYYTWDCASACVWNLSAIVQVEFQGVTQFTKAKEKA